MITVFIDMVGDIFHAGHVNVLRNAAQLGDRLIVGVHNDDAAATYKRRPICTMEERIAVIESCRWVDMILPDSPINPSMEYLQKYNVDIVAGSVISEEEVERFYKVPHEAGMLRLLPRTQGISTTAILERARNRNE